MSRYDELEKEVDDFLRFTEQMKGRHQCVSRDISEAETSPVSEPVVESVSESVVADRVDDPVVYKKPKFIVRFLNGLSNTVFYASLVVVLVVVISVVQGQGRVTTVLGYSPFYIETSSMESVMPRGSLIITKDVPGEAISVGDDITFLVDTSRTVTHRVVKVLPDFESQGLAFETKGVDNSEPDKDKVIYDNVVGKVVLVLPSIGIYLTYVRENFIMVALLVVLGMSALHMLKLYLTIDDSQEVNENELS